MLPYVVHLAQCCIRLGPEQHAAGRAQQRCGHAVPASDRIPQRRLATPAGMRSTMGRRYNLYLWYEAAQMHDSAESGDGVCKLWTHMSMAFTSARQVSR